MSDYRQRISSNSEGVTTMGDFNYTPTRNVKPSIRYETKAGNLSAACLILRAENETRARVCDSGISRHPCNAFYVKELPVKNRVTKTCLDTNNAKN